MRRLPQKLAHRPQLVASSAVCRPARREDDAAHARSLERTQASQARLRLAEPRRVSLRAALDPSALWEQPHNVEVATLRRK